MSQQQPAADASSQQLSEEQVRAYLAELRKADVGEIVAQVMSTLLNGAQVKLGRADGRLLIDAAAAIIDQIGAQLDDAFTSEVTSILSQLRMAQVEAEKESGAQPEGESAAGAQPDRPTADPTGPPPPPRPGGQRPGAPQQGPGGGGKDGSRLWVPPGSRGD